MSGMAPVDAVELVRAGAPFRLQREDGLIHNFDTGENRRIDGVRLYVQGDKGRWVKTQLWLLGDDQADAVSALESMCRLLRGRIEEGE